MDETDLSEGFGLKPGSFCKVKMDNTLSNI